MKQTFNAFTVQIREQAARRHGLEISDDTLSGDLDAQTILELFIDPQFQAGLAKSDLVRVLKPSAAVN